MELLQPTGQRRQSYFEVFQFTKERRSNMKKSKLQNIIFSVLFTTGSILLLAASYFNKIPISLTEDLGFITGALCVWLTVKQNIWNWPIGIANSAFFTILFFNARFFADTALQIIYIILGFLGWYWWLKGGKNKTELKVGRTNLKTAIILTLMATTGTFFMHNYLISINDSAPFLDALTTVLSLVAQYLLTKKLFENWFIWITADIIYVYLYAYKGLYLTSILYFIFMLMCIQGLRDWRRSMLSEKDKRNL
jgi:nicotinamide mononucleotide transporter